MVRTGAGGNSCGMEVFMRLVAILALVTEVAEPIATYNFHHPPALQLQASAAAAATSPREFAVSLGTGWPWRPP